MLRALVVLCAVRLVPVLVTVVLLAAVLAAMVLFGAGVVCALLVSVLVSMLVPMLSTVKLVPVLAAKARVRWVRLNCELYLLVERAGDNIFDFRALHAHCLAHGADDVHVTGKERTLLASSKRLIAKSSRELCPGDWIILCTYEKPRAGAAVAARARAMIALEAYMLE